MFLSPVGGIHSYFVASAQKAKQAGNDAYSEALKSNKSALEAAAAMYTMAIALAMPDDPERHVRPHKIAISPNMTNTRFD